MAIAQNYPKIRPTLNLSFALTKALDPRITYARASAATYYGTETAKAEENLFVRSQEFNVSWTGFDRVLVGSQTAPDGTSTAWQLNQAAGTTASGRILQNGTVVASQDYVISVFAKANTRDFLAVQEQIADNSVNISFFNLSTGALGTINADHTAAISDVGNGWYRCSIKLTTNAARTASILFRAAEVGNSTVATDDGNGILIWGAQLEQRSAVTNYTPTTTQRITNFVPVLESAAAGEARFDHNPVTGESLGLLIEESRTNLLTFSEEFDNAAWTKTNSSITANTIVAPDGTLTSDALVENTSASANHNLQRSFSVTSGTSYTLSIYAKAAGRSLIRISGGAAAFGSNEIQFNLSAGTATVTNGTPTASIVSVGNGWYRCAWTGTATATTTPNFFVYLDNGSGISFTGDGFSGIFIWGASLEQGAFPTSYVKTTTAQVTRAADAASMTGANFSSFYNQAEGTLFAEGSFGRAAGIFGVDDTTNNNRMRIGHTGTTAANFTNVVSNSVQFSTNSSPGTLPLNTVGKMALSYKVNDYQGVLNGASAFTNTSALVPIVTQATIGTAQATEFLNGHIRKLAYYPKRIANDQLQGLTT